MHRASPTWALPLTPTETWGSRRGVVLAVGLGVALLPLLRSGGDLAPALALAVAGASGTAAAVSLQLLSAVREDPALRRAAAGAAAVPVLVLLRTAAPGAEPALALLTALALPLAVLAGRRAVAAAVAVVATGVLLALRPAALPDDVARVLLLVLSGATALAAVRWLGRSPAGGAGPHAWVLLGLVLLVAGTAAAAAGAVTPWAVPAALAATAAGLSLSSTRRYRRQARRWRQLESSVRGLVASSPLLPGLAVTPEDDDGLPSRVEVLALLECGAVAVALQPVVALADGAVVGHEALARFGGRTSTDRWFRGAGVHGLSVELELLTVTAALDLLPGLPEDQTLAVNLSPIALGNDDVHEALRRADLARVVVEVTEHEAVGDYAALRQRLAGLREDGARIAVDDIGSGFASLRHALLLRPDVVKLDQSLTRGVHHDPRQRALVRALVRFAEEIGVELVAEGIETTEQAAVLRDLGLVLGQGWGLGVPVLQRGS
ncbi:MAG TPA: EAL domain-containing protein [Mycobacteriales bacterium]|nr:EAL domain-containing protein [Mycobacteriales bacterium]